MYSKVSCLGIKAQYQQYLTRVAKLFTLITSHLLCFGHKYILSFQVRGTLITHSPVTLLHAGLNFYHSKWGLGLWGEINVYTRTHETVWGQGWRGCVKCEVCVRVRDETRVITHTTHTTHHTHHTTPYHCLPCDCTICWLMIIFFYPSFFFSWGIIKVL